VVPLVRVRDELSLAPNAYRIVIAGVCAGEGEVYPDDLLALDAGDVERPVDGRAVKDPTFGLDALWIGAESRTDAIVAGYTVVDASTVIATHLNRAITLGAGHLFGLDEAHKLVESLKDHAPQLVAALTPAPLTTAMIAAVCRSLLNEGIPLKEFRRIAEAMLDSAASPPALIAEAVRQRIGPIIVQTVVPSQLPLPAITLSATLEAMLAQAVRVDPTADHPFEPSLAHRIVEAVSEGAAPLLATARPFAIVTSPTTRRALARLLRHALPETRVLSYAEVPDAKAVDIVAVVGGRDDVVAGGGGATMRCCPLRRTWPDAGNDLCRNWAARFRSADPRACSVGPPHRLACARAGGERDRGRGSGPNRDGRADRGSARL